MADWGAGLQLCFRLLHSLGRDGIVGIMLVSSAVALEYCDETVKTVIRV